MSRPASATGHRPTAGWRRPSEAASAGTAGLARLGRARRQDRAERTACRSACSEYGLRRGLPPIACRRAGRPAGQDSRESCPAAPAGRTAAKRAGSPLALIATALACGASLSSTCASSGRPPSSSQALVAAAHARRTPAGQHDGRRETCSPAGRPSSKARRAPWQASCWRPPACRARPRARDRACRARSHDDHGACYHRAVGHVAEHQVAEQDRPQQRGVAEWRDVGDLGDAHRHDDALVADEKQHGRHRQQRRAIASTPGSSRPSARPGRRRRPSPAPP